MNKNMDKIEEEKEHCILDKFKRNENMEDSWLILS